MLKGISQGDSAATCLVAHTHIEDVGQDSSYTTVTADRPCTPDDLECTYIFPDTTDSLEICLDQLPSQQPNHGTRSLSKLEIVQIQKVLRNTVSIFIKIFM